jgi:cyanosortase A-associated protein
MSNTSKQTINQTIWETFRVPCLGMVLGGAVAALVIGLKTPLQPRPAIAPYTFPHSIPLAGWQPSGSFPIPPPENQLLKPLASQGYKYQRDGKTLIIEMRYLTATKADVSQFVRWYAPTTGLVNSKVHQQPGKGAYLFFTDQDRAYLSFCLTSQGQSIATGRQYLQSRILSGINPRQLAGWLFGEDTLFDQRCLWSHLSLGMDSSDSGEENDRLLRETWELWSQWWRNNFPPN